MNEYPLFLTLTELISGNGFIAAISAMGRGLIVKEGEEGDNRWWFYGVQPGGLAESGVTPDEARLRFVQALRNFFADMASRATSYEAFAEEAKAFFCEIDTTDDERWKSAVELLRSGVQPDSPFSEMPRKQAETECAFATLKVGDQVVATPNLNSSESVALPVAA
jgi:hypothetical protein